MDSLDIGADDGGTKELSKATMILWSLVALFPIALELFFTLHHLKLSWDDAAITAAFSRTWAHTGKIALTPVSQVVEGYSSVLWFLLLSVPYFFTDLNDAGLIWMKVLSAIFLVLSLVLIYRVALRQFASHSAAIVSALLLAYCFTSNQEIETGMEMNLAVFLLLSLYEVMTRERVSWRVAQASVMSCLLLLTRFEMPFMLALLFCGFAVATYRDRPGVMSIRDLLKIVTVAVLFFGVMEVWRHHMFGEWMPNTIYAKRFPPYRDWSTLGRLVESRQTALNEPIRVLRFPMVIALLTCVWAYRSKQLSWARLERIHPSVWLLASGCFLFEAAIGVNWGHPGRMVAAMIPFLVLLIVGICVSTVQDKRALGMVFATLLVVHGMVWLRHQFLPYRLTGIGMTEPLGTGAEAIRVALHQDRIVVMMSDVGGSSLCCERLEVLDSGLLADATLAHTGWAGFADYFRKKRPDVVETHYFWAQDARVYEEGLLDGYSIVASRGVRLFVRDDLYLKLVAERAGPVLSVENVPACMGWFSEDKQFSLEKKTCLVLNDAEAERNLE